MRPHSLVALALAAAIATPGHAGQSDASQTISSVGSIILLVPFAVAYQSGVKVSEGSAASVDASKRWSVGAMRPDGDKTALELHSDDHQLKIDMAIQNQIAQDAQLKVGDRIEIATIGRTGYIVKKGKSTIALLAEPATGMGHSAPRT